MDAEALVARVLVLHSVAVENARNWRPCDACGSTQVQIVEPIAQEWRCRMCGHEWGGVVMVDMTLCTSEHCPVRERCRRNPACPTAYRESQWDKQAWAPFEPEKGEACNGFEPEREKAK